MQPQPCTHLHSRKRALSPYSLCITFRISPRPSIRPSLSAWRPVQARPAMQGGMLEVQAKVDGSHRSPVQHLAGVRGKTRAD